MSAKEFGRDSNGGTLAYSRPGIVEFYVSGLDGWSGRLSPSQAREQIDALHVAVHAAADAAETDVAAE